jgi:membrane-associated phospholipid phosphatase
LTFGNSIADNPYILFIAHFEIYQHNKTKRFWLGTFGILSVQISSFVGSYFIATNFPNRPIPDDLIMMLFPYTQWGEYLTDAIAFVMMISFLIYLFRYRFNIYPLVTTAIGIGYFIRGIIIMLTPLARPTGFDFNHGVSGWFYRNWGTEIAFTNEGMFPSGHIMIAFMYLFFVDTTKHKVYFWFMFVMAFLQSFFMVQSRGHYSIDVVGGIMLAIIIGQNIWRLKNKLTFK